jgi:hypothetical protein
LPDAESGSPGRTLGWSRTRSPPEAADGPGVFAVDGLGSLGGGGVSVVDGVELVAGVLLVGGRLGGFVTGGLVTGGLVTGGFDAGGPLVTGVVGLPGTVKVALAVSFVQFPIGTLALTVYVPGLADVGTVAATDPLGSGAGRDWTSGAPAQKKLMYRHAGWNPDQEMVNPLPAGPVLGLSEMAGLGGGWAEPVWASAAGAAAIATVTPTSIRNTVLIATSIAVTHRGVRMHVVASPPFTSFDHTGYS